MSTFDIVPDAPGLLRVESLNVQLQFSKTGPTTGRISWNIPSPAAGCMAGTQAYCGMLVTLDTSPASQAKTPIDGTMYSSDPSASPNIFAGDKLDSALIVGAFYNDRATTYFDVTGLSADSPYYVSGYPVDCELRYFGPGVHAYSTEYTNRGSDDTNGSQVVVLNPTLPKMGVAPDADTGLIGGVTYSFDIQLGVVPKPKRPVDSTECTPTAPKYHIEIEGSTATTYAGLVQSINDQFAVLEPAARSADAPSTGAYVYSPTTKQLRVWNGSAYVSIPVVTSPTAPNLQIVGQLWYNPLTYTIHEWSGSAWAMKSFIAASSNPRIPTSTSLWFDGVIMRSWNGVAWCSHQTWTQTIDPSLPVVPVDGSYWFNTKLHQMFKWDTDVDMWVTTATSVTSPIDPNTPQDGVYWTTAAKILHRYSNTVWTAVPGAVYSDRAPTQPTLGTIWVDTLNQTREWLGSGWIEHTTITSNSTPEIRSSCDTWFDTSGQVVYVWDESAVDWIATTTFIHESDPTAPPTLPVGSAWISPSASPSIPASAQVWNGTCFVSMEYVWWPVDPRQLLIGSLWLNTTTQMWYQWSAGGWLAVSVLTTGSDPSAPAVGTMWFDSSASTLRMWNGASWISVAYSTTDVSPVVGTRWYNPVDHILYKWSGSKWDVDTPKAVVELDCNGNLKFTDTSTGSLSFVSLTDGTLFRSLSTPHVIHDETPGTDGASDTPTYNEIGIGTDGTDNIRSSLANDLRYELGYPVVDVELTHEQIDYAITKALSEFRARSGLAYKRGFFFMRLNAENQRYYLTNKVAGLNTIVEVVGVYRMTSSFMSSAHGSGVYGQIVMQHLYHMGTFDLLSYHIMTEYTKLMEQLFAAKITFTWNEQTRELFMHHRFPKSERMVCIEATVERTEQDIMSDRYAKPWIRKYAGGICRLMLAEIRGKFSSLPGAGGNISLNANDLRTAGTDAIASCIDDIENFIADRPEEYGMGSSMLFG